MKNKLFKFMSNNNIKILIISLLMLFMILPIFKNNNKNINLLTMISNKLFDSNYTEEIESIEIESPDYIDMEPGSWHIDKSARWTGTTTAQVTFDVSSIMKTDDNYKDIILVIDISGSMEGEKIDKVKSDSKELAEVILSNSNNNVALITYDNRSQIISEFTNDKDIIIELIDSIAPNGETNYNAPLKDVEQLMKDYEKQDNRDIVTLFLTDGYPNIDTPNQIATYNLLKEKYPYMKINGIQYEMGSSIKEELVEVSDIQWVANMQTLNNVLFETSISPNAYNQFEVVDYIDKDYFILNSIDDIEVSSGTVNLEEEDGMQKITWKLDDIYKTGFNQVMNINLNLKEQYIDSQGYYPTNTKEQVIYKLDDDTKVVKSDSTPVLKRGYNVVYDINTPDGCNIDNIIQVHYAYENVIMEEQHPSCNGYLFKGWEIVNDVKKINDNTFIMPSNDVIIKGTWSKHALTKSMDGTISKKINLYETVKLAADNNENAKVYRGKVTDKYDDTMTKDIYYYTGSNPNNNVLFGGYCWQIVRTTATDGVKMIYNGVLKDETIYNIDKISNSMLTNITNDNVYPYEYDPSTKNWISSNHSHSKTSTIIFSVGEQKEYILEYEISSEANYDIATIYKDGIQLKQVSGSSNGSINLGTIDSTNEIKVVYRKDGSVSSGTDNIKFSIGFVTDSERKYTCNNSGNDSQIGTSQFNPNYDSVAYVGYMYNKVYRWKSSSTASGVLYGNDIEYDGNNYKLINTSTTKNATHHYTCNNTSGVCSIVRYYHYGNYYIELSDGINLPNALNEMLYASDVNKTDSTVKNKIDTWYQNNLLNYSNYLEDTVFCNDRIITDLGAWDPNGDINGGLYFGASERYSANLECKNITDRFSLSNDKAKLTYPVGLLSTDETMLGKTTEKKSADSYYLKSGLRFWAMTPNNYYGMHAPCSSVLPSGAISGGGVGDTNGIRPVISLKANTAYLSGDGSKNDPYIIKTN